MDTNSSLAEVKPKGGSFLKGPYAARAPYWVALAFTTIPAVCYWVMVEASDSQVDRMTALLTPMLAIVAGWVGYRQWRTAQEKLALDLFNRRFTVYDATIAAMTKALSKDRFTYADLETFNAGTRGAKFLFDENVESYLELLRRKLTSLADVNLHIQYSEDQGRVMDPPHRGPQAVQKVILEDRRDVVDDVFKGFMKLPG